jgi:hypothetical protein
MAPRAPLRSLSVPIISLPAEAPLGGLARAIAGRRAHHPLHSQDGAAQGAQAGARAAQASQRYRPGCDDDRDHRRSGAVGAQDRAGAWPQRGLYIRAADRTGLTILGGPEVARSTSGPMTLCGGVEVCSGPSVGQAVPSTSVPGMR